MGLSFWEGVAKASSMILVSEVGDKTFFLAALMAMRHPRRWVCAGSLSALWVMTLLSTMLGWAAPNLLPRKWTHALATLLFLFFGLRSLWDGLTMGDDNTRAQEEMREAQAQLDKTEAEEKIMEEQLETKPCKEEYKNGKSDVFTNTGNPATDHAIYNRKHMELANGESKTKSDKTSAEKTPAAKEEEKKRKTTGGLRNVPFVSTVFFQAFSLVFFGEWGDKSQIATIGLAADENVWGVALGGCLGHAICNGAAVIGGRHLATMISEKMVALFGGGLFLAFAAQSLFHGPPA